MVEPGEERSSESASGSESTAAGSQASTAASAAVLVLFAHPALEKSRINVRLIEYVRNVPGVTFHDLYEEYPTMDIDIRAEQTLLERHDIIMFQHPLFWYSTPAILKEWQDLVLEHGWAYGSGGAALEGKVFASAITTGGGEEAYRPEGFNGHTIRELLLPIQQTVRLCRMRYLAPFVVHGTHRMDPEAAVAVGEELRAYIEALRDGRLDLAAAERALNVRGALATLLEEHRDAR